MITDDVTQSINSDVGSTPKAEADPTIKFVPPTLHLMVVAMPSFLTHYTSSRRQDAFRFLFQSRLNFSEMIFSPLFQGGFRGKRLYSLQICGIGLEILFLSKKASC